ncbi:hypothetical protein [Sulfitobacter sp. S190]|uniref:hypothetical protein n=1 Tax=Sulfitobacter sp. S190 TaxID=2867022 RepID=UPI0021A29ED1|nr:hypothetical protein [Sulfitobacter sp. S190]UWR23833.1 hypothetical protein K3756_07705 [Sulfitobacter sp. S190]
MRKIALLLALMPLPALADVLTPQGKTIDCYCTDSGGARIELGETICLQVDGRMFMAQCQMSLNVPMWRETQEGCLSSSLGPLGADPLQKPLQSFGVYPEI